MQINPYESPLITPSSSISIPRAAGFLGNPGIVMMSPVFATMNPAPAETLSSLMWIIKSFGAPNALGSSEKLY